MTFACHNSPKQDKQNLFYFHQPLLSHRCAGYLQRAIETPTKVLPSTATGAEPCGLVNLFSLAYFQERANTVRTRAT